MKSEAGFASLSELLEQYGFKETLFARMVVKRETESSPLWAIWDEKSWRWRRKRVNDLQQLTVKDPDTAFPNSSIFSNVLILS